MRLDGKIPELPGIKLCSQRKAQKHEGDTGIEKEIGGIFDFYIFLDNEKVRI